MDENEKYKAKLEARIRQYMIRIERGQSSESHVSFEVLWSLFSAYEGGLEFEDLKSALPMKSWREDTVTVPRALIRQICEGWGKYRKAESGLSMGNAFGLEGGQGKSPTPKVNRTLDRELWRSKAVVIEILMHELKNENVDLDSIYHLVAQMETQEFGKAVKPGTVKTAYLNHGEEALAAGREKLREVSNLGS